MTRDLDDSYELTSGPIPERTRKEEPPVETWRKVLDERSPLPEGLA